MKESNRDRILKTRQELLNFLKACKWYLAREKFAEAIVTMDEIEKLKVKLASYCPCSAS